MSKQYRIVKETSPNGAEWFIVQESVKSFWSKSIKWEKRGIHYDLEVAEKKIKELLTEPKLEVIGYYPPINN